MPDDRLSKTETALFLGVSAKSIERYSRPDSHGRVRLTMHEDKQGGNRRVSFDRAEVEALKREMETPPPPPAADDGTDATPQTGRALSPRPRPALAPMDRPVNLALPDGTAPLLGRLVAAVEAMVPERPESLLVDLTRAAELSGVPRPALRAAIASGRLKAIRLGRGWRLRPQDVRDYVDSLFVEPAVEPKPSPKGARYTTGKRPDPR